MSAPARCIFSAGPGDDRRPTDAGARAVSAFLQLVVVVCLERAARVEWIAQRPSPERMRKMPKDLGPFL